jgi:hypothetical protein
VTKLEARRRSRILDLSTSCTTGMTLTKVLANACARDHILVNALLTGQSVTVQVANRSKREEPPNYR